VSTARQASGFQELRRDRRIREIAWRDLRELSSRKVVQELLLPVPWLALSCWLASRQLYVFALLASFIFFLTGLRIVHGAYHYTLGLPRFGTELVMFGFSVLMLGSMHAIQETHLRHHRHCLAEDDVEAMGARRTALGAILVGPLFPLVLHRAALASATRARRSWIWAELAANVAWIALVFGAIDFGWLRYHVLAMTAGQCLTAFFAVWTVHHGCRDRHVLARTIRRQIAGVVTFSMFFHVEHHLFPQVPTANLHLLARRLDRSVPEVSALRVF
jgi:fatty acid desaturase